MLDTSIKVKTDSFDGPLGLLLLLIQKEEMDIKKLDLTLVTQQYLAFLARMQDLNFDVAGDYLYLAATLLLLKSKTCLNEDEIIQLQNEDDSLGITSQADLIRRLEELQRYQRLGEKLWQLPRRDQDIFVRPKIERKSIVNSVMSVIDLSKLSLAMIEVLQKGRRKFTVVKRDRISIKEKLEFFRDYLQQGQTLDFDEMLQVNGGKEIANIVITFISVLELARWKKLDLFQNGESGKIYVTVLDSLKDFNVEMADGFIDENDQMDNELDEAIGQDIH